MTRPTLLLIDPAPAAMVAALEGFDCLTATDAAGAARAMADNFVQAVVCAGAMAGLLPALAARWPETVLIVTGDGAPEGVWQVLPADWRPAELCTAVRHACETFQLQRERDRLAFELRCAAASDGRLEPRRRALRDGPGFDAILRAPHSALNAIIARARHIASFDVPVLITGEAGTGKAQLAAAIHAGSLRADRPLRTLDCAGLSDEVIEAELFGLRRGLPGQPPRAGLVQKADRGTLFLNGVDALSPRLQLALVRLATDGTFQPQGGAEVMSAQVRLISGATRDLAALVAEGRFRGDLYYALATTELALPPLRARPGDIALIAREMLFQAAARHGKPVAGLTEAALAFLEGYDWPGNLRELHNEITRMLIFAQGPMLGADLIGRHILQAAPQDEGADRSADRVLAGDGTLKDRVELIEMRVLRETLTRLRWNKSRAAAELGLSRVGLRAKLDRYGLTPPREMVVEEEDA